MLSGKTVIVAGAGRGIGRAVAVALGDAGANVVGNDLGASLEGEGEDITGCTFRAAGDGLGLVKDPEPVRVGFREGGWTPETIAERFRDGIADGIDLENLERAGGSWT